MRDLFSNEEMPNKGTQTYHESKKSGAAYEGGRMVRHPKPEFFDPANAEGTDEDGVKSYAFALLAAQDHGLIHRAQNGRRELHTADRSNGKNELTYRRDLSPAECDLLARGAKTVLAERGEKKKAA